MGVSERIFRIIKAAIESKRGEYKEKLFSDSETDFGSGRKTEPEFSENWSENFKKEEKVPCYPWDAEHSPVEDLKIFNLSGAPSWDHVKRGYRAECRKYHSDLHHNAPEKKEAAEEIMVIYNAAYARLKRHYQKK